MSGDVVHVDVGRNSVGADCLGCLGQGLLYFLLGACYGLTFCEDMLGIVLFTTKKPD